MSKIAAVQKDLIRWRARHFIVPELDYALTRLSRDLDAYQSNPGAAAFWGALVLERCDAVAARI